MRWHRLFAELEHELESSRHDSELEDEEHRHSLRTVSLGARVSGCAGQGGTVSFRLGTRWLSVAVDAVGADWFAGCAPAERLIVRLAAVETLESAGEHLEAEDVVDIPHSPVVTFAMVLRDLARRRVPVGLMSRQEYRHGTLCGAWADHCELALHPPGRSPRDSDLTGRRLFAYEHLLGVSLAAPDG